MANMQGNEMKSAGRATIFEIGDMIGAQDCAAETIVERQGTRYVKWVRAVPLPFYDGLLARLRSAWEVVCGRAYPVRWPDAGDLERALGTYEPSMPAGGVSPSRDKLAYVPIRGKGVDALQGNDRGG